MAQPFHEKHQEKKIIYADARSNTKNQQTHAAVIAKASEWLQAYSMLVHYTQQSVLQKTGSPYEDWATLTIVYMLLGFQCNMFPVTQLRTIVPTPDDF